MRKIILLVAIALSCVCWACYDNEIAGPDAGQACLISLSGEIDQVTLSRVNDGGFCHNDVMGVYIVDYEGGSPGTLLDEGNRATNLQFTFDEANNKWNSAYDVFWKDSKTPIDVYGYYPVGTPESVNAYAFEVRKDQSKLSENGEMGGYEASDFLWGKAENVAPLTPVVRLSFRHKMSNARVTLQEGAGFSEGEWTKLEKQVLVTNTKRGAQVDLATGIVTVTGEVATTGTIPYKHGDEFRAIVVPQEVTAGVKLFSITVDGVAYSFSKNETFTYVPSKMHNFTIRVDKKANEGKYEFVLVSESITAWEDDLASHDAIAREYIVIESEAGKLKECITAAKKDFRNLQNLKITGEINALDFYFMRDSMDRLQALNLKEVEIKGESGDYMIPEMAMIGKSSLLKLILPDKLHTIGNTAFAHCNNLTGSLNIPEGVTTIENYAFMECKSLTGSLSLPSTLITIGESAFRECGFVCELILPSKLKSMGAAAFMCCYGLFGELKLPSTLTRIESNTFSTCIGFTGSLTIPDGVVEIGECAFGMEGYNGYYDGNFDGLLTLPRGLVVLGRGAFRGCGFKGELNLPESLAIVPESAFDACDFSGELKLPKKLVVIGAYAFRDNWRLTGSLEFAEGIQSIGSEAFNKCRGIEAIIFSDNMETIAKDAFNDCSGIASIICKGTIPPYVQSGAFNGVPKDNFTLEVPESVVAQYQASPGWNEFKRISAHRELVCRPSLATAINTECTRRLVLNAEGEWEVESKPDWCSLSQMSGSQKTELTLTISEMPQGSEPREGEIVFKLKDKDYTTRCSVTQYDYEYDEDEIITLQSHTKGNGVNLVFLGDGFDAKEISKGDYLKVMKEQVERFFDIEPYRTYRDYFDIYTAIAVSPESGVGTINTIRYTKFETTYTGGVGLRCDYDAAFAYALRMPTVNEGNLNQSLVIITPNSTDYGGICQMWADGSAIAFCPLSTYGYPLDSRGVIQHEAGGHGFGKLGDEYIYHNEFIDFCSCNCCGHVDAFNWAKSLGWYENLSLTGKMHEVPWAHFIFDDRYSDVVDIYEGGFMHSRGVFRSEQNSCMNNDIPYHSAISREAIVKRIMLYAGETYSFDEFVKNDKRGSDNLSRSTRDMDFGTKARGNQYPPVIHKGRPSILK
ncbi:MAG: leucine-rich repeat protein [Bacteroidales bacterium]|nr:leucine-rich repeat protein [Bacteroidales bacterium]